jgi:effector-binding domain-containing protein
MSLLFAASLLLPFAQAIGGTVADHLETQIPHAAIFCKFSGQFDDHMLKSAMDKAYARIDEYITSNHLKRRQGSFPSMYVQAFSEETASLAGEVAIEIESVSQKGSVPDGMRIGETPSGRALKFETTAPYGEPNEFYEDISRWVNSHKLKRRSEAWEVYIRQGDTVAPHDRLTYIYYSVDL